MRLSSRRSLARWGCVALLLPVGTSIALASACSSSDENPSLAPGAEGGPPPELAEASCSSNVEVDPKNCGRCGHDCRGGSCLGAICQPVVIAAGLEGPTLLGSDATRLFFVTAQGFGPSAALFAVAKDGSAPPQAVAGSALPAAGAGGQTQRSPWVWDGSSFYVVESAYVQDGGSGSFTTSVLKLDVAGGQAVVVHRFPPDLKFGPSGGGGQIYGVSATHLFVLPARFGGVVAIPKAGGAASPITQYVDAPSTVAADSLYFHRGADLHRADFRTDGGEGELVAAGTNASRLQIVGTDAYYTSSVTGSLRRLKIDALNAGPGALLAFGQDAPFALAVDATTIYFSASGEDTVLACPLAGCGAEPRVIAKRQFGVAELLTDEQNVYWSASKGGTVVRVAK